MIILKSICKIISIYKRGHFIPIKNKLAYENKARLKSRFFETEIMNKSTKFLTYGLREDGSVSRCYMANPVKCRLHAIHGYITEKAALKYNEAIRKANETGFYYIIGHNELSKQTLLEAYDRCNDRNKIIFMSVNSEMLEYEALSYLFAVKKTNNLIN